MLVKTTPTWPEIESSNVVASTTRSLVSTMRRKPMVCQIGVDGLDVSEGTTALGTKFQYEGEVRNAKPNGLGIRRYEGGTVRYGYFKDGEIGGDTIMSHADGAVFWPWDSERKKSKDVEIFDKRISRHSKLLSLAKEKASAARSLAALPWSPKTHHYNKYKQLHDIVMVVLLCAQRIRKSGSMGQLPNLPAELWQIILCFLASIQTETSSFVPLPQFSDND
eukprot:m.79358 g.79358  ORF g.79358 m.79358 type:complete len:221 (+) comp12712_c0_seq2:239-901(+)